MYSVLIILNILFKISDRVTHSSDDIAQLFSMLYLRPLDQNWSKSPKFLDLNIVMAFIPDQYYQSISKVLAHFTKYLGAKLEWVYVIPLIHIFEKHISPYDKPAIKSDS